MMRSRVIQCPDDPIVRSLLLPKIYNWGGNCKERSECFHFWRVDRTFVFNRYHIAASFLCQGRPIRIKYFLVGGSFVSIICSVKSCWNILVTDRRCHIVVKLIVFVVSISNTALTFIFIVIKSYAERAY